MYNKLTCLFGHHDYSKRRTVDKNGRLIHLCKICKRSACLAWTGEKIWYDYDAKGNKIHTKRDGGPETWYDYDEEGNLVYKKWSNGLEVWYNKKGYITRERFPNGNEYRYDDEKDVTYIELED